MSIKNDIQKYLKQRRVIFFTKYPNARMQQIIINAENSLAVINENNTVALANFAIKYIWPLIPSQSSRYYNSALNLYNKLIK